MMVLRCSHDAPMRLELGSWNAGTKSTCHSYGFGRKSCNHGGTPLVRGGRAVASTFGVVSNALSGHAQVTLKGIRPVMRPWCITMRLELGSWNAGTKSTCHSYGFGRKSCNHGGTPLVRGGRAVASTFGVVSNALSGHAQVTLKGIRSRPVMHPWCLRAWLSYDAPMVPQDAP